MEGNSLHQIFLHTPLWMRKVYIKNVYFRFLFYSNLFANTIFFNLEKEFVKFWEKHTSTRFIDQ
uniref:Uncharacterized protein n=1 Tax=Meloidogyne enterolobii TaxID=390850 RepID=A0A6V7WYH1_MELEN|nr:unnamed protein product [Meloidogyne enterolobii]